MKYSLGLLIAFFTLFMSCKPPANEVAAALGDYKPPKGAEIINYNKAGNHYLVIINTPQGKVGWMGEIFNGYKHGSWTTFHSNGVIHKMENFEYGKKHGSSVYMNERGHLTKREHYYKGQFHGPQVKYNHLTVKEEANYRFGKLEGSFKVYYDNGKRLEESTFKNNKREGLATWYDRDDNVSIRYRYKNGEKVEELPSDENPPPSAN